MFFGTAEPLSHYHSAVGLVDGAPSAKEALFRSIFHWGINAWTVYGIMALALAYFGFRYKLPLSLRSCFYPLWKDKINGPRGHIIDIIALCVTLLGIVTTLGFGAAQLGAGFLYIDIISTNDFSAQTVIIIIIMSIAVLSAVTGIDKGVKLLSEINISVALVLMLFVLCAGPTLLLLNTMVENFGYYLSHILGQSFYTSIYTPETRPWFFSWTILFWAWWLSWAPFVGMFIARISKGRTIREFIFGVLIIPTVFTIVCIAPFLRAIIMKKNHSVEFQALWQDSRFNRAPLISTILLRIVIAVMFVMFVIEKLFQTSTTLLIGIAVVLVGMMMFSRWLKKQSIFMERTFIQNLRFRDVHAEFTGQKRPEYEGHLLSRDLHLSDFEIPADSLWAGYTLRELNLGHKYGVHVASIIRGMHRINIPGANVRLFPGDTIQVIGTDEQLGEFARQAERVSAAAEEEDLERREMNLKQFIIDRNSFFLGKNIKESGIRDEYKCLVVGVEKEDSTLMTPDINVPFTEGDVVWVVGERDDVYRLLGKKEKEEE